jgi:hypothetical protein
VHIFRAFAAGIVAVFAVSIFTSGESRAGWVYDIEAEFQLGVLGQGQPAGFGNIVLGRIEFSTASGTDSAGVAAFQFNISGVSSPPSSEAYQASFGKADLQGVAWSIDSGANLTLTTLQAIQVGAPATPTVSACMELVFSATVGCGPVPTVITNGMPAVDPTNNGQLSIFGFSIFDQNRPNLLFRAQLNSLDIRLVSAPQAVPAPGPLSIMLFGGTLLAAGSFRRRGQAPKN